MEFSIVDEGRGAICAHAAGVGAGIAVVGGFVVLRGLKRHDRLPVGDGEDARFLADETFFDEETRAGGAKSAIFRDLLDGFKGFFLRGADDDAFACGESVGFNDEIRFLTRSDVVVRLGGAFKGLASGSRHEGAIENFLAEDLAPFHLGGLLARAKSAQTFRLEGVDKTGGQRRFRSNDGESNTVFFGKLNESREVFFRDRDVLGVDRRSGVTRRDINFIDARRLTEFPRERMFATAATHNKHVHDNSLLTL